jgi:hypothetical protein
VLRFNHTAAAAAADDVLWRQHNAASTGLLVITRMGWKFHNMQLLLQRDMIRTLITKLLQAVHWQVSG